MSFVVVAEALATSALDVLRDGGATVADVSSDRSALEGALREAEALIVRSATMVGPELLQAAPMLRVVGRAGVGVDNVDLDAATRHGVVVVNAPDANVLSAAEHTIALLLSIARRIPAAHTSLCAGEWRRSELTGTELHGKRLGLLGLGRVGAFVAQRMQAFGMTVAAFDPYVAPAKAEEIGVELVDIDDLLRTSHILSVHLPLTPETRHLLDADRLAELPRGAYVVNTARGGIVDEAALAEAVGHGHLAGAAVDVFEREPPNDSPLIGVPGVVVTPHLGASTAEAQDRTGTSVAAAVLAALDGQLVDSAVNLPVRNVSAEGRRDMRVAEKLAWVASQLAGSVRGNVQVVVPGHRDDDRRAIGLAALAGALAGAGDQPVSLVQVRHIAEHRGIGVEVTDAPPSGGPTEIAVTVDGRTVAGRAVPAGLARLTHVDGQPIDVPLRGYLLFVAHDDAPGLLAATARTLADRGRNIDELHVGRRPDKRSALTVMSLAEHPGRDTLDEVAAIPGVTDVAMVREMRRHHRN